MSGGGGRFGGAGLAIKYGVAATPSVPMPGAPLFTPEQADKLRAALEPQTTGPKTVEEAAAALADAIRSESAAADRHRASLAQVEEAHRLALARVAKLAEAHIAAREATAVARALVVELAKKEP